jgi:hypothetical protein
VTKYEIRPRDLARLKRTISYLVNKFHVTSEEKISKAISEASRIFSEARPYYSRKGTYNYTFERVIPILGFNQDEVGRLIKEAYEGGKSRWDHVKEIIPSIFVFLIGITLVFWLTAVFAANDPYSKLLTIKIILVFLLLVDFVILFSLTMPKKSH